jgi:hypothetical protein
MPTHRLPLEQLIGAPLRSLVMAQGLAAQAAAEFISEVGFSSEGDSREASARTFDFTYVHPVPDPANPGEVVDTLTTVSVPLLSLVGVPNLRIADATIAFSAGVVDVRAAPPAASDVPVARRGRDRNSVFPQPVEMIAVYAPAQPAGGGRAGSLTFSIHVVAEPPAEGLATVMDLLSQSVKSRARGGR